MLCYFSGRVGNCYCVGGEEETTMANVDLGDTGSYGAMLGIIITFQVVS